MARAEAFDLSLWPVWEEHEIEIDSQSDTAASPGIDRLPEVLLCTI